jgi:hypothetical protein
METYSSKETNHVKPLSRYLAVVFMELVPLSLAITFPHNTGISLVSFTMALMLISGIIFSGIGIYSSMKDAQKGFAMFCMVVGAVFIGAPQLAFLL